MEIKNKTIILIIILISVLCITLYKIDEIYEQGRIDGMNECKQIWINEIDNLKIEIEQELSNTNEIIKIVDEVRRLKK